MYFWISLIVSLNSGGACISFVCSTSLYCHYYCESELEGYLLLLANVDPRAKYLNLQHWVLEWVWDQPSHFRNLPVGRLYCLSVSHSVVPSAACHPTSHSLFCQQFVNLIVCTWEIALWPIDKYWNPQNGCSSEIKVSYTLGQWNIIENICFRLADTYEKMSMWAQICSE